MTARRMLAASFARRAIARYRILALVLLSPVLVCGPALAGGLYINEFATPSQGVAGAGAEAVAVDASTTWHNPAGMTRVEGNEVMLGAGLGYAQTRFDPDSTTPFDGGNGGNAGSFIPVLGNYGVASVNEDVKLGLGVFSISGASLDYNNNWTGRFQNQEISLLSATINPTAAFRITDWLSFGAGFVATYADLEFKLAVPPGGEGQAEIDGDDWAFGFDVGLLFELTPRTRLGVVYLSEQDLSFSGDLKIDPADIDVGSDTQLDLAQTVRVGLYHEFDDRWAVLGTFAWEDWSTLDNLLVSTDGGTAAIPRNWEDTYKFGVGVHYRPVGDWLLQVGFSYDTSPVSDRDRTADMPIDRQLRFAVGVQHQMSQSMTLGGSFEFIDLGDGKIDDDTLRGDYQDNYALFVAVNASWKF